MKINLIFREKKRCYCLFEKQSHSRRRRNRDLLSTYVSPRWLQWPGMGQAQAREPYPGPTWMAGPSLLLFLGWELDWGWSSWNTSQCPHGMSGLAFLLHPNTNPKKCFLQMVSAKEM